MFKLVVNRPDGIQELIKIDLSGRYFDPARVVWDERIHGALSSELEAAVGGMVRDGDSVTIDDAMLAEAAAAKEAARTAEENRKNRVKQAYQYIKNAVTDGDLTTAEMKNILKALVVITRNT